MLNNDIFPGVCIALTENFSQSSQQVIGHGRRKFVANLRGKFYHFLGQLTMTGRGLAGAIQWMIA
ncbi:MAG: hypothetical protein ACOYO0_02890 [Sandarakinorhabdus sp.]